MILLLTLIVIFLLLILFIIWAPFFRANNTETNQENEWRDQTNIQLYQEHKSEIERDFAQGAIDEENYQYLLTELDKSLLQDMDATNKENEKLASSTNKRLSVGWPMLITLFILVFSITLYQKLGAYNKLAESAQQSTAKQGSSAHQQLGSEIEKIKKALNATPKNSDLWYKLGEANISAGNFKGAVKAFDQVIKIEGVTADLLGVKAQALYYSNHQKIDKNVQQLIDKALALDPLDPSTNILLGMDNFIHQRYQKAIHYWQKIVSSGENNVNIEALKGAIKEAQKRLGVGVNGGKGDVHTVSGPRLTLHLSLSKKFQQALAQGADKTVFVYAIPTNGKRMPLAAMKLRASDLPITITLTNAQAMSPRFNLASVKQVHIFAIVSQLGTPGIKSGDYRAELKNIAVKTTKPLELVVNELVP